MNSFNIDLDNNTDEDFFGSLTDKSSKLQQLFVEDALSSDDKQQSLKYKPSKNVATSSKPAATSTTLMAKVVTIYRQGELQGKVGLALIQNPDDSCNIIIYKTKAHILATLKLQPGKDLLYKQTKYWQFYDELSIYWSFSFDSSVDEEDFVDKLYSNSITFNESPDNDQLTVSHSEFSRFNKEQDSITAKDFTSNIPEGVTKETKNSLIKRMAKMGKPLPTVQTTTTTEFSDSSDTEVIRMPLVSTQKPSVAPRSNKLPNKKVYQQLVPSVVGFNSVAAAASDVYPINHLETQYMQMLLAEQRTQGSELRMNMNKLENKIEKVLDKLEYNERSEGKKKPEKDDEILELEEKLLLLKKENRKLKQNLQDCSIRESEESKINALLYEFKDDLEDLNVDYKQDLKTVLLKLTDKLKESYNKRQEMQKNLHESEFKFKELQKEFDLMLSKNMEIQSEIRALKQHENELKIQLSEKETDIMQQKEKVLDLENKFQEKNQETLNTADSAAIKSIMNNLYVDIADKLNQASFPHSEKMLSLIASSIKQQTLKSLQKVK